MDGFKIEQIAKDYNLNLNSTGAIRKKENSILNKKLIESFFKIEKNNVVEFISFNEKYYIVQLIKKSQIQKNKDDKDVRESIKAQLIIENKITENSRLAKEITKNKFSRSQMDIFAEKNGLNIETSILTNLDGNNIFSPGVIKRIFETENKSINLITDNMLKDNFIIYVKETKLPKIKKEDENYDNYKLKAKLRLANDIYNIYDLSLNKKYNVEINNKSLNRIKNSF